LIYERVIFEERRGERFGYDGDLNVRKRRS
jgi:hypothetical protein